MQHSKEKKLKKDKKVKGKLHCRLPFRTKKVISDCRMTLSNAAAVFSTALVLALSFLPPEASALPREREAFYKWSPRYFLLHLHTVRAFI